MPAAQFFCSAGRHRPDPYFRCSGCDDCAAHCGCPGGPTHREVTADMVEQGRAAQSVPVAVKARPQSKRFRDRK